MAEQRHTPGPWRAQRNNAFWEIAPAEGAGVGDVPFRIGDVCASAPDLPDGGLQEANARLIAAAPELLEALTEIRDEIARAPYVVRSHFLETGALVIWERAWRAVAKAEGRSS